MGPACVRAGGGESGGKRRQNPVGAVGAVPAGWGLLVFRRLLLGSCALTKRRRPLSCPHLVALCRCPEPPAGHGELREVTGGVGTCSRGVCSQPGCRAQRPTRPYGTRAPAPVCAITTLNTGTLPKVADYFFFQGTRDLQWVCIILCFALVTRIIVVCLFVQLRAALRCVSTQSQANGTSWSLLPAFGFFHLLDSKAGASQCQDGVTSSPGTDVPEWFVFFFPLFLFVKACR